MDTGDDRGQVTRRHIYFWRIMRIFAAAVAIGTVFRIGWLTKRTAPRKEPVRLASFFSSVSL